MEQYLIRVHYGYQSPQTDGELAFPPNSNFDFLKTKNNTSSWYIVGTTPDRWKTGVLAIKKNSDL